MTTPVPSAPAEASAASRRGSRLTIQGLGLQIGGATILKDVDLDVAAGSLVGVIGPNGAGKTTVRESDHALLQEMYQVKLVADSGSFVPELVDTVAADEVAPAEAE